MWSILAQVFLGWIYGHIAEYALHRWLLHGVAIKTKKYLLFHFYEHHSKARSSLMLDDIYKFHDIRWNAATKEITGLIFLLLVHVPLYFFVPAFYVMLLHAAAVYYFIHRKSHINFEWAKQTVPWHYDHHMGPNQHANYGVRSDLMDRIFKTRVPYHGTTKERADHVRRVRRWMREERRKYNVGPHSD